MLRLPDAWVWDFWLVDDGNTYHVFFLYASRALKDPELRHHRASIGHAVSSDLTSWNRVADAIVRSDPPAFDDRATWTGSVVRHPDGTWYMFYTGATSTGAGDVQSIGYAVSTDLHEWTKNPDNPILRADPRWYEILADAHWHDEAFRDPWVMPDANGFGWHMLITARANQGAADDRGVIGHATSTDLRDWTLRPPLTQAGAGFGVLEVPQLVEVDGQALLLFNSLAKDVADRRKESSTAGGVWVARAGSPLGPYDIAGAQPVTDSSLYVGRLIQIRETGEWNLLAFRNEDETGTFVGEITDPRPIRWDGTTLAATSGPDLTTTRTRPDRASTRGR